MTFVLLQWKINCRCAWHVLVLFWNLEVCWGEGGGGRGGGEDNKAFVDLPPKQLHCLGAGKNRYLPVCAPRSIHRPLFLFDCISRPEIKGPALGDQRRDLPLPLHFSFPSTFAVRKQFPYTNKSMSSGLCSSLHSPSSLPLWLHLKARNKRPCTGRPEKRLASPLFVSEYVCREKAISLYEQIDIFRSVLLAPFTVLSSSLTASQGQK